MRDAPAPVIRLARDDGVPKHPDVHTPPEQSFTRNERVTEQKPLMR
jgi:hypothetical protein